MLPTKTMRLYQAGLEKEDAVKQGADPAEFDALEAKYKGASIPMHDLIGTKRTEPYSCDYHTGGAQGRLLRATIRLHNAQLEATKREPSEDVTR